MYTYEYPKNMTVGRVCLEMSLKPFKKLDDNYIESVCTELFDQWKPLLCHASGACVMFWTSDGSEILDYSGNINDEFEWGRYIGIGNPKKVNRVPGTESDDERNLHVKPVLYMENPPVMHYSDLARIISAVKRIGKKLTGFDISVGETFDPGPEFAYSEFKFERHAELNRGSCMNAWIHCAGKLHKDNYHYAAYPNGIPEGTVFGEFLSKQFAALAKDVGFDYLWLSNGFGFSLDSWNWTGELFDGQKFNFDGADDVRNSICEFWRNYTPNTNFITEVRGSNLSTAMDISAHGCPIDEIYKNNIIAPPNSPWAALNSRFGLELVGYMSHMANVPVNGYAFRYYIHDPWWINCPWFDRYARSPHDIYLPLAVTRMKENGETEKPIGINFLSADDSFGEMPRRCPNEVIPHLLESFRTYPDAPGFLTWMYPFDYYCELGLHTGKPERMIMDDWFIESAIDGGFPLNTVVSDSVFEKSSIDHYKNTVIVCPVPEAGSKFEECVFKAINGGIRTVLYGSTKFASEKLCSLLGVAHDESLSGEFKLVTDIYKDEYETYAPADIFCHDGLVSNGGLCEISNGNENVDVVAEAVCVKTGKTRLYAAYNSKMNLCWIRGSFPYRNMGKATSLPQPYDLSKRFLTSLLLRSLLAKVGIDISFKAYSTHDKLPLILASSYRGGYYFTAFCKDETVTTKISTYLGAPIIMSSACIVEENTANYNFPRWMHEECRVFVKQKERSKVVCRIETVGDCMYNDRRISINGLKNADITFLPEIGTTCRMYADDPENGIVVTRNWTESNVEIESGNNGYLTVRNITGRLVIAWQADDTTAEYRKLGYIV